MVEYLDKKKVADYADKFGLIRKEMKKSISGQDEAINALLRGLLSNGHVLIEGVPGIAKTLIMLSMARILGCDARRIQFTPDLLPTDITGITSYSPEKGFYTVKGPIFTNFVLADEINRAPAKVQSAMLEAMQERKVTIGTSTYEMAKPFIVMATQNNIESLGVYTLPAAQVDRFIFKINMTYPSADEEQQILKRNIDSEDFESLGLKKILSPVEIMEMQKSVHKIYCTEEIEKYIVSLVGSTRDPKKYGVDLGRYIEFGASPRASISLYMGAKSNALLQGRGFVTPQDVKDVAHDVFKHRILLNYEGQAEQVHVDDVISEVLAKVRVP